MRWLLRIAIGQLLAGTGVSLVWGWLRRLFFLSLTYASALFLLLKLEQQGQDFEHHPGVVALTITLLLWLLFFLFSLLRWCCRLVINTFRFIGYGSRLLRRRPPPER